MEIKLKLSNSEHKDLLSYCNLNDLLISSVVKDSFTTGFNIERYGLLNLGVDIKEKEVIKEVIKYVEVPVVEEKEVVKIEYVEVEKRVEVPIEKVITKIEYVSVNDDEKIFQLNKDFDEERQKFSIKIEEMENIFQKEKNELISQIGKPNDKVKLLENTLQNLRKDLFLKQTTIKELEDKLKNSEEQLDKNLSAIYLKGSNLNEKI